MVLILATVSVSVVADQSLPKSLAFMKHSLVGVMGPVCGSRCHGDGGCAHDGFVKSHLVTRMILKESSGEMLLLPRRCWGKMTILELSGHIYRLNAPFVYSQLRQNDN